MHVSASTVRYELAELEELGLLTHPHTSAGRVPTDLGYRFYVDRLLESLDAAAGRAGARPLGACATRSTRRCRRRPRRSSQVTHLLALVTAPPLETTVVRHVEVLLLQPQVVVVVDHHLDAAASRSALFVFDEPVDPGLADWAREYLNEQVAGLNARRPAAPEPLRGPGLCRRGSGSSSRSLEPAFTRAACEAGEQAVYVGGAAGLMDEFRAEDISDLPQPARDARAPGRAPRPASSATLDSKRPFVRVGSEFEDPAFAKVSLVGAPYGLSQPQPRDREPARPDPHGLRQGDRRGPLGGRGSCRASSRSSTRSEAEAGSRRAPASGACYPEADRPTDRPGTV